MKIYWYFISPRLSFMCILQSIFIEPITLVKNFIVQASWYFCENRINVSIKKFKQKLTIGCSTAVEHSPHHPMVECSIPSLAAGTGR